MQLASTQFSGSSNYQTNRANVGATKTAIYAGSGSENVVASSEGVSMIIGPGIMPSPSNKAITRAGNMGN